MVAPIVCEPCLKEQHDKCMNGPLEAHSDSNAERRLARLADPEAEFVCGGQVCICYKCRDKGSEASAWHLSVWDRDMKRLNEHG